MTKTENVGNIFRVTTDFLKKIQGFFKKFSRTFFNLRVHGKGLIYVVWNGGDEQSERALELGFRG